jgi:hypothetical protein
MVCGRISIATARKPSWVNGRRSDGLHKRRGQKKPRGTRGYGVCVWVEKSSSLQRRRGRSGQRTTGQQPSAETADIDRVMVTMTLSSRNLLCHLCEMAINHCLIVSDSCGRFTTAKKEKQFSHCPASFRRLRIIEKSLRERCMSARTATRTMRPSTSETGMCYTSTLISCLRRRLQHARAKT